MKESSNSTSQPDSASIAALPNLQPPGAGIPAIERIVGGTMLRLSIRRTARQRQAGRDRIRAELQTLGNQIIAAAHSIPNERLAQRILISRLRGLEDSSRFWSVLMTLDHMRIVNERITQTLTDLAANTPSPHIVGTADVKPSASPDRSAIHDFSLSLDQLIQHADNIPSLETTARYPHPWFGPLNALGWFVMSAMHLRIHLQQIHKIADRIHQKSP